MVEPVLFYSPRGPGGFLSNFWLGTPIILRGHIFRSSEHLYQSLKVAGVPEAAEVFAAIRDAGSAKAAAELGRDSDKIRDDWDKVRLFAMRLVLLLKFEDVVARAMLLDTGDAELIEDTRKSGDAFWGRSVLGGLNNLGRLLMETRKFYAELVDVSPHEEASEISSLQAELTGRLVTPQYKVLLP